jgi:hypothetical protein
VAAPPSRIPPNVARLLPSTQMSYKAQVVWCLRPSDNDLSYMSQTLHGKRMAANEGSKSMIAWGPTAQFPQLPPRDRNQHQTLCCFSWCGSKG